ncbi:MAG TPA: aldose 1-epimerase family protein [Salegentibacter sp.]|nr:aldose 1-epimerase family protein [Salegentibacter sp.]
MFRIENDYLKVGILAQGAELCSIVKRQTGNEYSWQADPDIWANHSPILFPIVGGLKKGSYSYEGKNYFLPRHGFVRGNNNIIVTDRTENSLTFSLTHSEETLKNYPFPFRLDISYLLKQNTLAVTHKVYNPGEKPLYFSLGGHPAFNVPLIAGEEYDDHYLEFDRNLDLETNLLTEEGLISSGTRKVIENESRINLNKDLFNKDALIFRNINSKNVSLVSKKSGKILSVEYSDFKDLGIWAKPAAPFVCIEPWLGHADIENTTGDIKTKEGIIELMPSAEFSASYTITIE